MASGVLHLPIYATGFRGDDLEYALAQLVPISIRYGATRYDVVRSRDDQYKFLVAIEWENKGDWERYWYGAEFTDFRRACTSWFTVPLLYVWNDTVVTGQLRREAALAGEEG